MKFYKNKRWFMYILVGLLCFLSLVTATWMVCNVFLFRNRSAELRGVWVQSSSIATPELVLETEHGIFPKGQFRTRLEAFLEMIT